MATVLLVVLVLLLLRSGGLLFLVVSVAPGFFRVFVEFDRFRFTMGPFRLSVGSIWGANAHSFQMGLLGPHVPKWATIYCLYGFCICIGGTVLLYVMEPLTIACGSFLLVLGGVVGTHGWVSLWLNGFVFLIGSG